MVEDKKSGGVRGCIRTSRGPWLVHRTTKDGSVVTRFRYPSERERQKNKQREKKRREVSHRIFAGLRAHGNYKLPKHADTNDLLMALCEEAGWHVEEDGTIYKKNLVKGTSKLMDVDSTLVSTEDHIREGDYCKCEDQIKDEEQYCNCDVDMNVAKNEMARPQSSITPSSTAAEVSINLTLSLHS